MKKLFPVLIVFMSAACGNPVSPTAGQTAVEVTVAIPCGASTCTGTFPATVSASAPDAYGSVSPATQGGLWRVSATWKGNASVGLSVGVTDSTAPGFDGAFIANGSGTPVAATWDGVPGQGYTYHVHLER